MENVEYLGFLIEVVSHEPGTYEYSVFDMTGTDKPEFSLFETDDVEFVSYEAAVDDAKSWIRDFLFDDEDRAVDHIEKLYAAKKALSSSTSVTTTGNTLQKLTVDVFNRPDCPDWARYAAVGSDGRCIVCREYPVKIGGSRWANPESYWEKYIDGQFDTSGWSNSLIERPVLPKLTADVFDRPDCPKWARWAAVNADGTVCVFSSKPHIRLCGWIIVFNNTDIQTEVLDAGKFDPSDWQNSLIERPKKKETLPDWCFDGAFGWESGDYFRLEVIDADNPVTMKYLDDRGEKSVSAGYIAEHVKQARLRSYNAKEMPGLVNKVIEVDPGKFASCLRVKGMWADFLDDCDYEDDCARIISYDCDMLKYKNTIDGKPCGKLVHKEGDDWVE